MKNLVWLTCLMIFLSASSSLAQLDLETNLLSSDLNSSKNSSGSDKNSIVDSALDMISSKNPKKKKKLTLDELKLNAQKGDVNAQLDLGYIYLYGVRGANTDYKLAFKYYEMAAAQKNAIALNNLGSLYFNGIGTDVDYEKALSYFSKAADAGSADAAVNLAIISLGKTNEKSRSDYNRIFLLLEKAQKTNNVAKYLIGYSYYIGFHYDKDFHKAYKLIHEVAAAGYDEAQYILSDFYIFGIGTPKNYNKAVFALRSAASQGHADAIVKLADIYAEGRIYTRSISKAHVLYNVASVLGKKGAAEKRDLLEKNIRIEDLLLVQASAENYKPRPTEVTSFIRKTFGNSLKFYIDRNN